MRSAYSQRRATMNALARGASEPGMILTVGASRSVRTGGATRVLDDAGGLHGPARVREVLNQA